MAINGKKTTISGESAEARIDEISEETIRQEKRINGIADRPEGSIDRSIFRRDDESGDRTTTHIGKEELIIAERIHRIGDGIKADNRPIIEWPDIN